DDQTPAPQVGEMSIIVNSHGRPKALVVTTQVTTVPFDEVDAEHARLEGEGDLSLEQWRESHEGYFAATPPPGVSFSLTMPVLLQQFAVLYHEA
ncbi:MAG TPA: ASCH domain-containing protein, partial [Marmoricola sp.]|nr:ASCH domain-containing protein [Marmoricola sp.]